jgi:hypothetical protein
MDAPIRKLGGIGVAELAALADQPLEPVVIICDHTRDLGGGFRERSARGRSEQPSAGSSG